MCVAKATASSLAFDPEKSAAYSSPPRAGRRSRHGGAGWWRGAATPRRSRSPTWWPSVSLTVLKRVEIEADDRAGAQPGVVGGEHLFKAFDQLVAIGQLGEGIEAGHMSDLRFGRPLLGDVGEGQASDVVLVLAAPPPSAGSLSTSEMRGDVFDHAHLAVAAPDRDDARAPHDSARSRHRQHRVDRGHEFGRQDLARLRAGQDALVAEQFRGAAARRPDRARPHRRPRCRRNCPRRPW